MHLNKKKFYQNKVLVKLNNKIEDYRGYIQPI